MNFLTDIYVKRLAENEKNLQFWVNYLKELRELDLNVFADKLTVPTLVPIGNRILFRGEIIHTNEITVSLGADYFAKCSLKQAEILKQHRIKDAETKVDMYEKEYDYLKSQIAFSNENIYGTKAEEIVEIYSEEEDKAWRIKHRQNVRKYKKDQQIQEKINNLISDEELWNRLDELELQEELENELVEMNNNSKFKFTENPFVEQEEALLKMNEVESVNNNKLITEEIKSTETNLVPKEIQENSNFISKVNIPGHNSKMELLQQVIEKQTELERKLIQLQNREIITEGKTEQELISKLDEMEQLEELEDEMDRLDHILLNENFDLEEQDQEIEVEIDDDKCQDTNETKLKKSVSFADNSDTETLEILFKHSDVEPSQEMYCPEKGIRKPSDVYEMFPNLIIGATSILKKSKYINEDFVEVENSFKANKKVLFPTLHEEDLIKTVGVKDIQEKANNTQDKKKCNSTRPMSLFKKKRMQNKK